MPKIDGSTFKSAIFVEDKDDVRHEVLTEDSELEAEAPNVSYDPTVSGLTATDVKAAIDELKALIDAL